MCLFYFLFIAFMFHRTAAEFFNTLPLLPHAGLYFWFMFRSCSVSLKLHWMSVNCIIVTGVILRSDRTYVVSVSLGHGGVLPRKRGWLCQTRGQPELWRTLHHLHLLPQQELECQGAFRDLCSLLNSLCVLSVWSFISLRYWICLLLSLWLSDCETSCLTRK